MPPSARRNGLVSLEDEAMKIQDPFLRKALNLAVDGTDLQEIRTMMQLEIELSENRGWPKPGCLNARAATPPPSESSAR